MYLFIQKLFLSTVVSIGNTKLDNIDSAPKEHT